MDHLEQIRARFSDLLTELQAACENAHGSEMESLLTAIETVQTSRRAFYRDPFPEV